MIPSTHPTDGTWHSLSHHSESAAPSHIHPLGYMGVSPGSLSACPALLPAGANFSSINY